MKEGKWVVGGLEGTGTRMAALSFLALPFWHFLLTTTTTPPLLSPFYLHSLYSACMHAVHLYALLLAASYSPTIPPISFSHLSVPPLLCSQARLCLISEQEHFCTSSSFLQKHLPCLSLFSLHFCMCLLHMASSLSSFPPLSLFSWKVRFDRTVDGWSM